MPAMLVSQFKAPRHTRDQHEVACMHTGAGHIQSDRIALQVNPSNTWAPVKNKGSCHMPAAIRQDCTAGEPQRHLGPCNKQGQLSHASSNQTGSHNRFATHGALWKTRAAFTCQQWSKEKSVFKGPRHTRDHNKAACMHTRAGRAQDRSTGGEANTWAL
jgi:hypothetical protein